MIIIYHRILSDKEFREGRHGVWVENFREQMKYIAASFNCLSLSALGEHIHQRRTLPEKSVVITFDDGYLDNYTQAYPILELYNLTATFFVCPGIIENEQIFWWDRLDGIIDNSPKSTIKFHNLNLRFHTSSEKASGKQQLKDYILNHEHEAHDILDELQTQLNVDPGSIKPSGLMQWTHLNELQAAGMEIGAHTMTHASMGSYTFDHGNAKEEIVLSKKHLDDRLSMPVKTFAYPYGSEQHFDSRAVEILRHYDFDVAVSGVAGAVHLNDDLYYLPRIAIQPQDHISLFKSKVSGLYPEIYRKVRKFYKAHNGNKNYTVD